MTKFTLIIMKEVTVLHAHMTENSVGVCWEVLGHRWWCWWVPEGRSQALVRSSWFTVRSVNLWDETRCCWGRCCWVGRCLAKATLYASCWPSSLVWKIVAVVDRFGAAVERWSLSLPVSCCCEGSIGDSMLF